MIFNLRTNAGLPLIVKIQVPLRTAWLFVDKRARPVPSYDRVAPKDGVLTSMVGGRRVWLYIDSAGPLLAGTVIAHPSAQFFEAASRLTCVPRRIASARVRLIAAYKSPDAAVIFCRSIVCLKLGTAMAIKMAATASTNISSIIENAACRWRRVRLSRALIAYQHPAVAGVFIPSLCSE